MIKCPICGSRNIRCVLTPSLNTAHTGDYSCNQCGLIWNNSSATLTSEYSTTIKLPVPTTAEKLLWLVENYPLTMEITEIAIADGYKERVFRGETTAEAITAAYEWTRKGTCKSGKLRGI